MIRASLFPTFFIALMYASHENHGLERESEGLYKQIMCGKQEASFGNKIKWPFLAARAIMQCA